ncbi:ecto-ADP-ribosyltransferase 5 isoform X2 [Bombina bombina]|uniref:ecto-ADP-ribosyltransferase 5 isoform X2 n=1 Tax=Bombina bombina TaxID=8345 RepID=UPI00235B16F7|nr:ecto-ADP-ribosyltransferase 5 isoform X2 [Bombina bombina]
MITTILLLTCVTLCPDLVGKFQDTCDPDGDNKTDKHKDMSHSAGDARPKPSSLYHVWPEMKCNMLNLDMVPNAFDDQYKGCSEILETDIMPKILNIEKSYNPPFGTAWDQAKIQWDKTKRTVRIPNGFLDEFGIAISVYTTDFPKENPIYKLFNGNVSTAGKSREHYMHNFYFKALHFYLTRALQVLKRNSKRKHLTYRGTDDSYEVSEAIFRFGRFTSSSLNIEVAKEYYTGLLFELTTCFGVDIHKISAFPKELEVLIPVSEKFKYVGTKGNVYILNSTCELCSYFNCAYLGEEKQKVATCSSDFAVRELSRIKTNTSWPPGGQKDKTKEREVLTVALHVVHSTVGVGNKNAYLSR